MIGQSASEGSVFPVRGRFEKRSNGQLQRLLKSSSRIRWDEPEGCPCDHS